MKTVAITFAIALAVLLFATNSIAQVSGQQEPPPYGDYKYHLPGLDDDSRPRTSRSKIDVLHEPRVLMKGPLAPSESDRDSFSFFLKNPHTGLIRLIPGDDGHKQPSRTVSFVSGGGAYYSFADRSHSYGYSADIEYSQEGFRTGLLGANYGILTNIGQLSLEDIEVNNPRLAFIASYKPAKKAFEARTEQSRFKAGVTADGMVYRTSLPLFLDSTYLLRSINYRHDNSSDVLVAFRVVRKDDDDSIIIAWKLLKRYSAPKLKRNHS